MTNLQWKLLELIKAAIQRETTIQSVGYYPDHVEQAGNAYPFVMIVDGDEDNYQCETGGNVTYEYNVSLVLVHEKVEDCRIKDLLQLQNFLQTIIARNDEIFANTGAIWCKMQRVVKGDVQSVLDVAGIGYMGGLSARRIDFLFGMEDNALTT
jgi:dihydropteroate synthase